MLAAIIQAIEGPKSSQAHPGTLADGPDTLEGVVGFPENFLTLGLSNRINLKSVG